MPFETSCPGCRRPLRVPDDLVDHEVKCPSCDTSWTVAAPASDAAAPPLPVDERVRETPGGPAPLEAPRQSSSYLDDDDDDDDDERLERDLDERIRRRRGRQVFTDAKSRLSGPAIGLFVTSGLLMLATLMRFAFGILGVALASAAPGPMAANILPQGISILYAIWLAAMAGVTLYGGLQMMKMRSYGWSVAACICAIIPNCECCFLIGMPFGIWGLVVLFQPDVKRAFAERPRVETMFREPPVEDE